jgi:hypothetical protein
MTKHDQGVEKLAENRRRELPEGKTYFVLTSGEPEE